MFSKCLLLTLSSQPTEEDFLTAAFASFLRNHPHVLGKYVRWLGVSPVSGMTITIHKPYGPRRERIVDMEVNGKKSLTIIQENKTESSDTRGQLHHYYKILSQRTETTRLLVYATKYREKSRLIIKGKVRFKCIRWHQIASFLGGLRLTGHSEWFRKELIQYLKGKNMAAHTALDISKLNKGWRMFVPQKQSLEVMFREAEVELTKDLKPKGFRLKLYSEPDNMGLSLFVIKGRHTKVAMQKDQLGAWVGLYYWSDGQTYLCSAIYWRKTYADRIKPSFHSLLRHEGFRNYPDDEDNFQEFYREGKTPLSLFGKSSNFEVQSTRLLKWLRDESKIVTRLLRKLERS